MIGLVGGIAPETTVGYYRMLIEGFRAKHPDRYPAIVITSVDLTQMLAIVERGDRAGLADLLVAEVGRLAAAGATVAGFAANTPHMVFDAVAARVAIPLVSIVTSAAEEAARRGLTRVGLLGTRFTMEASFYRDVFAARGIAVVAPPRADRDFVHRVYFDELVLEVIRPETRDGLLAVITRLVAAERIEAVILGGTELSLILTPEVPSPVPLIDTTRLHVAALLARDEAA
ncbi:MAG: amino acid racemase [Candidatus Eisenbacteria bacterium]|nr:amino acid racemase [Candidatus Eisenbacteria bacterium]